MRLRVPASNGVIVAIIATVAILILLGPAFATPTPTPSPACAPSYGWVKRMGGAYGDQGRGIACDAAGNVYVTGGFYDTVDFAQDWGGSNPKTASDVNDVFVTKVNSNGSYAWTKRIGGTGSDSGRDVEADGNGNVYVIGIFSGTVNFASDWSGTDSKTSAGPYDIFLTKVNSNGSYAWTKRIGASGAVVGSFDIASDNAGSVYLTGFFGDAAVNFAADWGGSDSKTPTLSYDVFITKVNSDGSYGWTKRMGGAGTEWAQGVTLDGSGNIYVTGMFDDTTNFAEDWGGNDTKSTVGLEDIFVTKISAAGTYAWTRVMGSVGEYDEGHCCSADSDGNVYVTGVFTNVCNFAADWGGSDLKTPASIGFGDAFVTRINSDGSYGWTARIGGPGTVNQWDEGYAVTTDGSTNIYVTGRFYATVDFASDWGLSDARTSVAGCDVFITAIDVDGNYGWTRTFGGGMEDVSCDVVLGSSSIVYVTGCFEDTVNFASDFGGSDTKSAASPVTYSDAFIMQMFCVSGTPTPPPTALGTATPTRTPSASPTTIPTGAPTFTPTLASTATSTRTPTATPTRTVTATPTRTPTATKTATSTWVPTPIPTPGSIVGWGADGYGQASPPSGDDYVVVSAYRYHSLALRSDGSLAGWGDNSYGVPTVPSGYDYVAVDAGGWQGIALKTDGSVVVWGNNTYGQIGDKPVENGFVAIASGAFHCMALRPDGSIVSWGGNDYGEVANSPAGNDFVAISGGGGFSLALKVDGSLAGWGDNTYGETSPPPGNDYVAISAGGTHGMALRGDGSVVAWGWNGYNQVTDTPSGNDFAIIDAGKDHNLAIKTDGSIVAWGRNDSGESNPPAWNDYVAVCGGNGHSLAIRGIATLTQTPTATYTLEPTSTPTMSPTGTGTMTPSATATGTAPPTWTPTPTQPGYLVGWGDNTYGQTTCPSGNNYVAIAAGEYHSLALKSDGSLVGWGDNGEGQTTCPSGNNYVAIAAGEGHNLALKSDGSLVGWGWNNSGQTTCPSGNDYVAIAAGYAHSLALKSDGSLVGWGGNDDGETTCPSGNNYVAIAARGHHSLALKSDGSLVGWGNNDQGQTTCPSGNNYVAIAAGWWHGLALKSDGSLVGWGNNYQGQTTCPSGSDYVAIAAGGFHSLALKSDGSLVGWGWNDSGQTTCPSGNNYVAIAAGYQHSLGIATLELPTSTPTQTPTSTHTLEPTPTPTEVPTHTPTLTSTEEPTPTPTMSPTWTGTMTPTEEPSVTPAPTVASTSTPTATPTPIRPSGYLCAWGYGPSGETTCPSGNDFKTISSSSGHTVALRTDGSLVSWGSNDHNQLSCPSGTDFVAAAAGWDHNVALRADGSLAAAGRNDYGQITCPTGNDFVAVGAGLCYSIALRNDGSLVGWGKNEYDKASPPSGNDFVAIAVGPWHSLAIKTDGSLVGWGAGTYGETTCPPGNTYVGIAAGGVHSLAVKMDGSVVGWGRNRDDQISCPSGSDFLAVAAGEYHSLALKADGSLVGWGYNVHGQTICPPGNGYVAIAAGGYHSVAISLIPPPTWTPTMTPTLTSTPTQSPTSTPTRVPTPLAGDYGIEDEITFGDANAQTGRAIKIEGSTLTIAGRDNGDALLLRYSIPVGMPAWQATWGGADNAIGEWGLGVDVSSGDVFMAGSSLNFGTDGVGTVDAKGAMAKFCPPTQTPVWTQCPNLRDYQGTESFQDVVKSGTDLYACGSAQYANCNKQAVLCKFSDTGSLVWTRFLTNTGCYSGIAYSLVLLNGSIYVAGEDGEGSAKVFLAKYDSSGNQAWKKVYQPVSGTSGGYGLATDGTDLYITGWKEVSGNRDVWILKTDASGNKLWETSWGGPRTDQGRGIYAGNGRLLIVGETSSFSFGDKDALLVEVNSANGNVLGASLWEGAGEDVAYGVDVSGDYAYVVGETSSIGNGSSDVLLLTYRLPETPPTPTGSPTVTATMTPTATPTGCILGRVLGSSFAPGRPYGLTHDGTNRWAVARLAENDYRIHKLDIDGTSLSYIPSPGSLPGTGLAWDGQYLYMATGPTDCNGSLLPKIWKISAKTGGLIDSYCISSPQGLAIQGLVWDGQNLRASIAMGSGVKGRIYRITTSGVVLDYFETDFDQPAGLAFDGGYLYCLDENDGAPQVHVLTPSGNDTATFEVPPDCSGGFSLTWDPVNRCLWLGDVLSEKLIQLEVCNTGPTVTPTVAPTLTPTATRTRTPTKTPTMTSTSQAPTKTPTRTPTATRTSTPTRTATITSSPTFLGTASATSSPTATETLTPTATSTSTLTATPSATMTATATPGNFPVACRPDFRGLEQDQVFGSQVDIHVHVPEVGGCRDEISVRFEYSPDGGITWIPIDDSVDGHTDSQGLDTQHPFFAHWNVTNLAVGAYQVRATGIHVTDGPDPNPIVKTLYRAESLDKSSHRGEEDGNEQHFVNDKIPADDPSETVGGNIDDNTVTSVLLQGDALSGDTRVNMKVKRLDLNEAEASKLGLDFMGVELREFLLANGQTKFENNKYGLVSIEYPDEDQDGYVDGTAVREEDLKFYAFDESLGLWKEEAITMIDPVGNVMLSITGHFSLFGVLKERVTIPSSGWLRSRARRPPWATYKTEAETPDGTIMAGMELYGDRINGGIAGLSGSSEGLTEMCLGHYDSGTKWFTGIALANPDDEYTCEVTLNAWGNDGTLKGTCEKSIPPMGKVSGVIPVLFDGLSGTGWIEVKSTKGVLGLEVYGQKPPSSGIAALPGGAPAQVLYISHYASDKKWWTGISITNPNSLKASVRITAYDNFGNVKKQKSETIQPRCKISGVVSTWLGITGTGSIKITSDQPVFGLCVFGQNTGTVTRPDIAALVAQTPEASARFPSFASGNPWESSIAVVNPNEKAISVKMAAYATDGTLIDETELSLGPRQKNAGMVNTLFTLGTQTEGSITADSADSFCAFELFMLNDTKEPLNSGIAGVEPSLPGEDVILPHYASNAQWWTHFALWNPGAAVTEGHFEAYGDSGVYQDGVLVEPAGMGSVAGSISETFKTIGTSKKTSLYAGFDSKPIRVNAEEFKEKWRLENMGK